MLFKINEKIRIEDIKGIKIEFFLKGSKLTKKFRRPIVNMKAKNIDLPCKWAATDCWRTAQDPKKEIENGTKIHRNDFFCFEIL